jgi:hypothetical protein
MSLTVVSLAPIESAMSTAARNDARIAETAVTHPKTTRRRLAKYAAAATTVFAVLWPVTGVTQYAQATANKVTAIDNGPAGLGLPGRNGAVTLTSHLPWLAPVGHRQPRKMDVPENEALSPWERQHNGWMRNWIGSCRSVDAAEHGRTEQSMAYDVVAQQMAHVLMPSLAS